MAGELVEPLPDMTCEHWPEQQSVHSVSQIELNNLVEDGLALCKFLSIGKRSRNHLQPQPAPSTMSKKLSSSP